MSENTIVVNEEEPAEVVVVVDEAEPQTVDVIEVVGPTGPTGPVGQSAAIVQPEPPDPTGLAEGTWWVDEDSEVPPFADGGDGSAAVADHEAKPDPHPQYLTQAEGDAAYASLSHTHPSETEFTWGYQSNNTMADPGTGNVRTNTDAGVPSTQAALSKIDSGGVDTSRTLASLAEGDMVLFQEKDNANNWGRYKITASATDNGTWFLLPVESFDPPEQHGSPIAKNQAVIVRFTYGTGGGGGGFDQAQADLRYVQQAGATMTGGLYVDNGGVTVEDDWLTVNSGNGGGLYVEGGFEIYHDPATMGSRAIGFWRKSGASYQPLMATQPYEPATKKYVDDGLVLKQAADADLTALAGLTATTGNMIQSVGSAWSSQTPAQVKTSLVLTKTDVGLGNVDNTSDVNKPVSTAQATADGLRVLKDGDTMTNSLAITRSAGSSSSTVRFQTSTVNRWAVGRDWVTESTGNQGSGFVIARYDDAGVFIDTPLFIDRATGLITVLGNPTVALGVATKAYADTKWTMWTGTQAAYDAIGTKNPSTLYVITG